ncbi:MAG: Uma2 family endonuclease [Dehalococcoidia bacterium]|nr:Uma2 family endonuclease [Dehalococcoidia bacterium]
MVAQPASVLITADEFDLLPEPGDGSRLELVDGEVVQMMTVTWEHGELQAEIASRLREFVRAHKLGGVTVETGFRLHRREGEAHIVRSPDVAFVARDRLPPPEERSRGSLRVAPDLAVEIVSPEERDAVLQRKVANYLAAGVRRT